MCPFVQRTAACPVTAGISASSRPDIADQRLLLAAEQDQQNADDAKNAPRRSRKERSHQRVPKIAASIGLQGRLNFREALWIDQLPYRLDARGEHSVSGYGFRAVVDEQDEPCRQADQPDKAQKKPDHGPSVRPL